MKGKISNSVKNTLKKYTGHPSVKLANRGNTAILAALKCAKELNPKKYVLIPDQGGWLTFLSYPKRIGFKVKKIKTDYGIIDLKDLKNKIKNASALIYTNPSGYFAEQPIKEIYDICKNNCLVILDASGSIGSKLCNGDYADIIIASFGKWKPVNLNYGGFISFKGKSSYKKSENLLNELSFDNTKLSFLNKKLKNLKKRYNFFYKTNKKIKKDLKGFKILHKGKEGINVIVAFNNKQTKNRLINYCERNKYEFTICPRYIRVNEKAISIEVKRLLQ